MTVSIRIGMICHRTVEAMTVVSLWDTAKAYPQVELELHPGDALVTRARSTVATHFLRDGTEDVLVTVDSDISFMPPTLIQIAEQAHALQAIVVGAYATRSWQSGQVASMLGDEPIEFNVDPTPKKIMWGASGFMAIPRVVFERLRDETDMPLMHASRPNRSVHHYPFYEGGRMEAPSGDIIPISEDYDLCIKARAIGIPTYVNPAVRLGHVGLAIYQLEHIIWRSEPPSVPLVLKKQGVWEAAFSQEDAPYVRMPRVDEPAIKLNRQQRRNAERHQEKVLV